MSQSANLNLDSIRRRAYQSANQDGLLEVVMGAGFLLAALVTALDVFLDIPLFFLIGIPASLFPLMLTLLRQRYTHQRIGYVDLVSAEGKRLLNQILIGSTIFGVFVFALTLVALLADLDLIPVVILFEDLALVLGMSLGAILLVMAVRYGIRRFYGLGALSMVAGLLAQGISLESADPVARWLVYFALMAVILLPSGLLMFAYFLRQHPVIDIE